MEIGWSLDDTSFTPNVDFPGKLDVTHDRPYQGSARALVWRAGLLRSRQGPVCLAETRSSSRRSLD